MGLQEKGVLLLILGIVAVVLITGLILMISGEKTGNIVTYRNTNPEGCYRNLETACYRNLHCSQGYGVPVEPQPLNYPSGFAVCRCLNQITPDAYHLILMCA